MRLTDADQFDSFSFDMPDGLTEKSKTYFTMACVMCLT